MVRPYSLPSLPPIIANPGSKLLIGLILLLASPAGFAQETYKWSVQYLIDSSQSVMGRSQQEYPRQNRGLAISPDGKSLYASYLKSFNHSGEVRRIRLDETDYEAATVRVLQGILAKAIAVDPDGRVYLAEIDQIAVYDSRLREQLFSIDAPNCEGMAVVREGSKLVLYASIRSRGVLTRWELETSNHSLTDAIPKGLDGEGELKIPEAKSLRGVAVDKNGRIWMADLAGNRIYRVNNDGKGLESREVTTPIALAFDGDRCFITQEKERQITIADLDMNLIGTLSVPWDELTLSPLGNNHTGALAGLAIVPGKGFYVSNQGGQTADQRSTYGKEDAATGRIAGRIYLDAGSDDNEPILHAVLDTDSKISSQ